MGSEGGARNLFMQHLSEACCGIPFKELNSRVQKERADFRSSAGPRGEVKQKQSLNSGLWGGRLGHNCLLRGLVSGAGRMVDSDCSTPGGQREVQERRLLEELL